METQLPKKCVYLYTWHKGESEARYYWRTNPGHNVHTERFESGVTYTSCDVCGYGASDY